MLQNDTNSSSHADQPPDIEELLRQIAQAKEQATQLGKGGTPHYGETSLVADVASMLARVEDLLRGKPSQDVPVQSADVVFVPSASAPATFAGSGAVSVSVSTSAQAPQPLRSSNLSGNSALGGTTEANVPPAVPLNLYSEPTFPARLEGKFADLHSIALTINSLGGQAEILRNPNLWKQVAFKQRLIGREDQDDQYSKLVIALLQKTQRVILGPFEQYCVDWSRLSEAEMNQRLAEYAATTREEKIKLPCHRPYGEEALPIVTAEPIGERADKKVDPATSFASIGQKFLEAYFLHFYPGIPVNTKIERLLKMPLSQAKSHSWTRTREDWLTKFQRDHAGRDVAQVAVHLAMELITMAQQRVLASTKNTEIIAPHSPGPPESGNHAVPSLVTRCVLFSTELVRRANAFVEETIQKIEDFRAMQKRIDVPESDRELLKVVVTGGYDAALSFYHTVALHYMLYQNEKTTRTFMMQAVMVLEQCFFSSTGYPTHIITLDYARSAVSGLRNEIKLMTTAYAERCQKHLKLNSASDPSGDKDGGLISDARVLTNPTLRLNG